LRNYISFTANASCGFAHLPSRFIIGLCVASLTANNHSGLSVVKNAFEIAG
jgi:hypothetical protein